MFKHILVPTDGSPLSQDAARSAVIFAKEIGARITAFHTIQRYRPSHSIEGPYISLEVQEKINEATQEESRKNLDFVENLCRDAGVDVEKFSLTHDQPYTAIIEAAKEKNCDLIFMASHGRSGVMGLLLGSETNKVLTHSKIPVLVFRENKTSDPD